MNLAKAMTWLADDACLNGTGAGMPLGVLHDPALVVVAKEGAQVGDTLLYANLTKMLARLHPACFANWFGSPIPPPSRSCCRSPSPSARAESMIPAMRATDGGFELRPEKGAGKGSVGLQYGLALRQEVVLERSMHVLLLVR